MLRKSDFYGLQLYCFSLGKMSTFGLENKTSIKDSLNKKIANHNRAFGISDFSRTSKTETSLAVRMKRRGHG